MKRTVGFAASLLALLNLQIPPSLAGAGEVNLVFTIDGKSSNSARLRIR